MSESDSISGIERVGARGRKRGSGGEVLIRIDPELKRRALRALRDEDPPSTLQAVLEPVITAVCLQILGGDL